MTGGFLREFYFRGVPSGTHPRPTRPVNLMTDWSEQLTAHKLVPPQQNPEVVWGDGGGGGGAGGAKFAPRIFI